MSLVGLVGLLNNMDMLTYLKTLDVVILQAEILRMQERTNQDIEAIRREASAVADEKVRYVIVTNLLEE